MFETYADQSQLKITTDYCTPPKYDNRALIEHRQDKCINSVQICDNDDDCCKYSWHDIILKALCYHYHPTLLVSLKESSQQCNSLNDEK